MDHLEEFVEVYEWRLDGKNRIVIPSEWRETLRIRNPRESKTLFYLTTDYILQGEDKVPFTAVYDVAGYVALPNKDRSRFFRREMDGQSRLIIPPIVKKLSQLEKRLVLAAAPDGMHMRVFSAVNWGLNLIPPHEQKD